ADSAAGAAEAFARVLWSGGDGAIERLATQAGEPAFGEAAKQWRERFADLIHPDWAVADAEIASVGNGSGAQLLSFDETLLVRLRRRDGDELIETPAVAVTVRRSARGWSVTTWQAMNE